MERTDGDLSAPTDAGHGRLPWLIEQSPLGIIEWSPDRRVRRWNSAATDVFGYDADEMIGEPGDRLVPTDEPGRFADHWERLVGDEGADHVVTENVRKDGVRISCEWYNTPIFEDGELVGVLSMVRDVTERERRQEVIKRLHEATRDLMEARTPQAIGEVGVEIAHDVLDLPYTTFFLYDEDEEVLRPTVTSDATDERFGDSPTFEVGEGITGTAFAQGEIEIHDNGQEDPRAHPEGPSDIRSFVALPLGEYGLLAASSPIVGAFDEQDVDVAKILAANMEAALARAERERTLQRQNERLDEFASLVSHDLRNPLSVARANLELARETNDPDRLDAVDDAIDRMADLIDGLLTLARDGELGGDATAVDLADCANEAFAGVDTADATLQFEPGLGTVTADPDRLRELLENLFRNAIEHAGRDAAVRVGPLADESGFYVADDGLGVPPDERERIFDHGYSGSGGTGIGLAIVAKIADAHGWTVDVGESDAGGARFEVRT